ncbi:MAG: methylenetetrahydrofolate--tRNA-(uracil(54)-C(5))-methyltransferase (FADH(2)-oxidizing) TrmFO [Candidatus Aminicenantia bacterium]
MINVIGGGLAGSESALQIASRGIRAKLFEMRPVKMTEAHTTPYFAELVCSNSLGSEDLNTPSGLLKEELKILHSFLIEIAKRTRVPAGFSLAVDRRLFSQAVTLEIEKNELIERIFEEVKEIPKDGIVIIATGPLTSDEMMKSIYKLTGKKNLYFYDASSPIVTFYSINMEKAYFGSRYDKGRDDFINCPMTREEYERFWRELVKGEKAYIHPFEREIFFEGCLPIEEMGRRGIDTLRFGPLKPVGLRDKRTGEMSYAVVQLRRNDLKGEWYELVGFQTRLRWKEQERIFRMIPCLENAEFVRFGKLHVNFYLNSPALLTPSLRLRKDERIIFAGQITGAEGYCENIATGLIAALSAIALLKNRKFSPPPITTAIGNLCYSISNPEIKKFDPLNFTFGLLPPLNEKVPKKYKKGALFERALRDIKKWIEEQGWI